MSKKPPKPYALRLRNLRTMSATSSSPDGNSLFLPFMGPFYRGFAQPYGWAAFRLVIGGLLMVEGWPKIISPMAQTGFVESIGMYPGWFFSPLLAIMQFVGGAMIAIGLFTRPIALANAVMLLMTIWFHITHPYGDAFLTAEGVSFLKDNLQYLTAEGQSRLLSDGGAAFLHQVQSKAEFNSTFWAAGAALIAAFGGGQISVDRLFIKREF
jgi:putative oxidoreductase